MSNGLYIKLREINDSKVDNLEEYVYLSNSVSMILENYQAFEELSLISKLGKQINFDISFFSKPNYFELYLDEDIENEGKVAELEREREESWVKIDWFVTELEKLLDCLKDYPEYGKEIDYDRKYWMNYFENGDFENDMRELCLKLEKIKSHIVEEFTFDAWD